MLCFFCLSCSFSWKDKAVIPPITDVSFVNKDEFWVATSKGEVFYQKNGRNISQNKKIDSPILQFYFLNTKDGWSLDENGIFQSTSDGGENWNLTYKFENEKVGLSGPPKQIIFSDIQTGWIIDWFSVLTTNDGGKNWKKIPAFDKINLPVSVSQPTFIFPVNKNFVLLGMTGGELFCSIDAGLSWENIKSFARNEISSIYAINESLFFVGNSEKGGLFLTEDGGKNWSPVLEKLAKPNTAIRSLDFISENIGWAAGFEYVIDPSDPNDKPMPVLFQTSDGGKIWKKIGVNIHDEIIHQIKFFDAQNGWFEGERSIYKTKDGGMTWEKVFEVKP